MLTKSQILNQLHSLRHTGFDVKLSQQASSDGFPPPFSLRLPVAKRTASTNWEISRVARPMA